MLRSALLGCALAFGIVSAAPAATLYFQATMKGSSEVPPTKSDGTGTAKATLDTVSKSFSYQVTFDKLSGPATAAHFHGPAAPGKNAGVVVPIDGQNPTSPATGTATLTDAQIKDLRAGKWYVNVHTAANPGGEIRGQVMRGKAPASAKRMNGGTMPMKSGSMPASGSTAPAPSGTAAAPSGTMPAPSSTMPAPSGAAPAQK
jgi:hypothetical protein